VVPWLIVPLWPEHAVLTSDIGDLLVTSEQIVAMSQVIWPSARIIEIKPYKADRWSWSGSSVTEGFTLTISAESGLIAQLIAGSLDKLKDKLDQRSRKKNWGSF
jgi:hypothetical protein